MTGSSARKEGGANDGNHKGKTDFTSTGYLALIQNYLLIYTFGSLITENISNNFTLDMPDEERTQISPMTTDIPSTNSLICK